MNIRTRRFALTILAQVLIVAVSLLVACGSTYAGNGRSVQQNDQAITQSQVGRIHQTQPPPNLTYSLELKNLYERLQRFNVPDKISYIYLMSYTGDVVGFYTVKGKVSHVDSNPVSPNSVQCQSPNSTYDKQCGVSDNPQLDGSYGTNGNAIFWFTADDEYMEWAGQYLLKDKPTSIQNPTGVKIKG